MRKIDEHILFRGSWLTLKEITLLSEKGEEIRWELIEHSNNRLALVIAATLRPSKRWILIRQYQPAIEKWVLSFPSGLAESGDIQGEALRELEEETGYSGQVVSLSPALRIMSGIMTQSVRIVRVEVDENLPANLRPHQSLERGEEIEVVLVPEKEVKRFIVKEVEKGREISAALWYAFMLALEERNSAVQGQTAEQEGEWEKEEGCDL